MKVNVEISMGEYFDKITILKIKQAHGIGDSKELDMLLNIKQDETNSSTIDSLVGILFVFTFLPKASIKPFSPIINPPFSLIEL